MPFHHDSRGVKPSVGGGGLLPKGRYFVMIMDTKASVSSKGNNMVTIEVRIEEPAEVQGQLVKGRSIKYHNIVFLPPDARGAGMSLHFLKCIGEPYDQAENLDVDEARWIGKKFWADVEIEPQKEKGGAVKLDAAGKTKMRNVIKNVLPGPDAKPGDADDEVPF